MMQARADGELRPAERAIVDQHVAECPECASELQAHRRLTARLFESLSMHRFSGSMRRPVVENLPEMDRPEPDVAAVNWRAKHPRNGLVRLAKLAPFAATVVVLILAVIIQWNWPEQPVMANRPLGVGQVLLTLGSVEAASSARGPSAPVYRGDGVAAGDWFRVGRQGAGMLRLERDTYVKAGQDAALEIRDARTAYVENGKVWLDVGEDARQFTVTTPGGKVTVPGTSFMVAVDGPRTTVVVESGVVRVANLHGQTCEVGAGYGVEFAAAGGMQLPKRYDLEETLAWAAAIGGPDTGPDHSPAATPDDGALEFDAEELFAVSPWPHSISRIRISWREAGSGGPQAYDVRIFTADEASLKRARLSMGGARGRSYRDIALPRPQKKDVFIKLAPLDGAAGETVEFQVKGIE